MKRIPILIQLIGILFLVLVIPASIVTYYTGSKMIAKSTEEIATTTMEKTQSNKELNELMLLNIIEDTLQVASSEPIKKYSNVTSYAELNENYANVSQAISALNSITDIVTKNDSVYSVAFYIDEADYIISTNKGIVKLANFEDMTWLEEALDSIHGAEGIWYPRVLGTPTVAEVESGNDMGEEINVLSYVYRLSRLATSTRGILVINVYESSINNYINSSIGTDTSHGYLIDQNGRIISHEDKELLYTVVPEESRSKLMGNQGTYQSIEDGETYINTYLKSDFYNWIYISKYSLNNLMESTNHLRQTFILFTVIIIIVGSVLTIVFATLFSKPMRMLVKDLKKKDGLVLDKKGNELLFIRNAFNQIQVQQEEFHKIIKAHENETKKLILHNLISGNEISEGVRKEVLEIFPYSHFIVAVLAVDNSRSYVSETTHDMRKFHRYTLFTVVSETFSNGHIVQCVRYNTSMAAIIFNIKEYDSAEVQNRLREGLKVVANEAKRIMGYSVTIGVGKVHTDYNKIADCTNEALQAVNQRLIKGKSNILFWSPRQTQNYIYYSCYDSEKKIMNYLETCDFDSLRKELEALVIHMKKTENISNDNILMVFNQLIGSTIKYMVEHNLDTNSLLGMNESIYSIIANLDTLDDIKSYLLKVYQSIIEYTSANQENGENNYCEQFMRYLKDHYKEELIFEEVADKIGISYSYLRRIVKETTGKSILDNMNSMRIEEVKRLLLHTNLSIVEIAEEVGYHNAQSLCRFFKKFEGINPTEFKSIKQ